MQLYPLSAEHIADIYFQHKNKAHVDDVKFPTRLSGSNVGNAAEIVSF